VPGEVAVDAGERDCPLHRPSNIPAVHAGLLEPLAPTVAAAGSLSAVSPTLSNILGLWRNLWTDGYDLAVRARSFVTSHLRG
jgi:hypothetical protein